jgi:RHH-type proline utilization regulon transcriptional repressor/proline dehydrogenase/delta 1-pyrroline-5-carboxylate dehydrogenase
LIRCTSERSWEADGGFALAREGQEITLAGPVGERNLYSLHPRGKILCLPASQEGLEAQLEAIRSTGNRALLPDNPVLREIARSIAEASREGIEWISQWDSDPSFTHVLIEDFGDPVTPILSRIAAREGSIPIVQLGGRGRSYRTDWMYEERAISIDITAAGGNASLMAVI